MRRMILKCWKALTVLLSWPFQFTMDSSRCLARRRQFPPAQPTSPEHSAMILPVQPVQAILQLIPTDRLVHQQEWSTGLAWQPDQNLRVVATGLALSTTLCINTRVLLCMLNLRTSHLHAELPLTYGVHGYSLIPAM